LFATGPTLICVADVCVSYPHAAQVEDVEDRRRSIAQFEGELFYEPDDIPEGLDPAAAAELRLDHAVRPLPTFL
jgi:hypothetical protein